MNANAPKRRLGGNVWSRYPMQTSHHIKQAVLATGKTLMPALLCLLLCLGSPSLAWTQQTSSSPATKTVIFELYQGMSNGPGFFDFETGSLSDSQTRRHLRKLIQEELSSYNVRPAEQIIQKWDCNYEETDIYAKAHVVEQEALQFFACYENKLRSHTSYLQQSLHASGDFAYALTVVFWTTSWMYYYSINEDKPTSHHYFTQTFVVTKDGQIYWASPKKVYYGFGWEVEREQRNPQETLFPRVAYHVGEQLNPILSTLW